MQLLYSEDFTGTITNARDPYGNPIPEITTVAGLTPFWREASVDVLYRPEMQVIDAEPPFLNPPRTNGERGLKVFKLFARHDAGYWKQYVIPDGITKLTITASGHHWYSQRDDAFKSEYERDGVWRQIQDGDPVARLWVGADTDGGTNAFAGTVQWYAHGWYDQFDEIVLDVDNPGALVTVFIRSTQDFPFKHADAYWSGIQIYGESQEPVACPGQPREDYERRYHVWRVGATPQRIAEIKTLAETDTSGPSYDDAGVRSS